jgi:hypothetical protein
VKSKGLEYEYIPASDPTDYDILYEQMQHRVLKLRVTPTPD